MTTIPNTSPNPFNPLFRALAKTRAEEPVIDANSQITLVNYAENLLQEIFNKSEQAMKDYDRDKKQLTQSYNSTNWLSINFFGKAYAGLELRALRQTKPTGFIELSMLNNKLEDNIIFKKETKENKMFKDALRLLFNAELVELQSKTGSTKSNKVKITDKGKEYLLTIK